MPPSPPPSTDPEVNPDAPGPLDEVWPARAEAAVRIRGELREWLVRSAVPAEVVADVLIATNEAVANAIEHGSLDGNAAIRLRAERVDGRLRIEVVDAGTTALRVPDPDRGRGMAMMRAVMDVVELRPSPTGTTVRMERTLP